MDRDKHDLNTFIPAMNVGDESEPEAGHINSNPAI